MKTKIIRLSKIKIKPEMAITSPRPNKLKWKYSFYRDLHKFESEIILDRHYHLIDGYTTYLLAKMFGLKKIKVIIKK